MNRINNFYKIKKRKKTETKYQIQYARKSANEKPIHEKEEIIN